jgi:hypothetical protein
LRQNGATPTDSRLCADSLQRARHRRPVDRAAFARDVNDEPRPTLRNAGSRRMVAALTKRLQPNQPAGRRERDGARRRGAG